MRLFAFALVLTAVSASAKRQPPVPCDPGTFLVTASDQAKLATSVGSPVDVFTLGAAGAVTFGPCDATAKVMAKRRATVVAARMPLCGIAANTKLVMKIAAPGCAMATGTFHAKKRRVVRFTATRTATTTTLPGGGVVCGNGIRDGAEACEGLDGCGAQERCTSACTCAPVSPRPTVSQGLIAAALARGDIDYPTSLVYRAWALFGDSRLPPAYDGQTWQPEDNGLFREAGRVWDSLDPQTQADLMPFLLRPNEPGSYYSPTVPSPGLASAHAATAPAASVAPTIDCPFAPGAATRDWRYTESTNFVIWSCGGGDPLLDPYAAKRAIVADVAEQAWNAMTPDTVQPPDDSSPVGPARTGRLDVYLLEPNRCKDRSGGCVAIPVDVLPDGTKRAALAAAVGAAPCKAGPLGAQASSSFVIVDVDQVTPAPAGTGAWLFRYIFAHEFFHVIENAFNLEAQGGGCAGDGAVNDTVTSWLVEASAEWAAWAYFPGDGADRREALFYGFQTGDAAFDSLHSLEDLRPYEAFLYPFFVQQEQGGQRSAFLDVWKNSGGARSAVQLDDVLNGVLPFSDHFRDFAVRNFDTTLPGNPVTPTYQAVSGANIPPEVPPIIIEPTIALDIPREQIRRAVSMKELTAQYEHYTVAESLRYVKLDLQTLANSGFLQADLLANVKGTWQRRKMPGLVVEFCRDDPGDDIREFYLVLSHHDRRPGAQVTGSYTAEARATCPVGWSGVLKYVYTDDDAGETTYGSAFYTKDDHLRTEETWTLGATTLGMPPDSFDTIDALWTGSLNWTKVETYTPIPPNGCVGYETLSSSFAVSGSGTGPQQFQVYPEDQDPNQVSLGYSFSSQNVMMVSGAEHRVQCNLDPLTLPQGFPWSESIAEMIGGLGLLVPDPADPGHYAGKRVIFHDVVSGIEVDSHVTDATVEWDIRRRRQ